MNQLASAEVVIDYGTLIVQDPNVNEPNPETVNIYDYVPGLANFLTCGNCGHALVEVWQADEIQLRPDTLIAAVIPFPVSESDFVVEGLFTLEEKYLRVPIPEGRYASVYQIKRSEA